MYLCNSLLAHMEKHYLHGKSFWFLNMEWWSQVTTHQHVMVPLITTTWRGYMHGVGRHWSNQLQLWDQLTFNFRCVTMWAHFQGWFDWRSLDDLSSRPNSNPFLVQLVSIARIQNAPGCNTKWSNRIMQFMSYFTDFGYDVLYWKILPYCMV